MSAELDQLLQSGVAERIARQNRQIETAKLLTTFATAIAATVTASALQTGPSGAYLDLAAAVLLGLAFVGVILVIVLDRSKEVNREKLVQDRRASGMTDEQIALELRIQVQANVIANEWSVRRVKIASAVQLTLSAASGIVGCLSLIL